jgi:hypothetical protein
MMPLRSSLSFWVASSQSDLWSSRNAQLDIWNDLGWILAYITRSFAQIRLTPTLFDMYQYAHPRALRVSVLYGSFSPDGAVIKAVFVYLFYSDSYLSPSAST